MLHGTSLAQKLVWDHIHSHFFSSSGKWKHSEETRMIEKDFHWKYNNPHHMNNALPNLMNYSTASNICPKSVYPHPNLQYICINLKSGLWPEMKMEPTILGIEDLVWHKGMEQPELPGELGPAGSKDALAWNSGGTSSQSRDEAKQKGGEQVATWLNRKPGFQDSPLFQNQPHFPGIQI